MASKIKIADDLIEKAKGGDSAARSKILEDIYFLTWKKAHQWKREKEDIDEIQSLLIDGVLAAVETYNPNGGANFQTWACHKMMSVLAEWRRNENGARRLCRRDCDFDIRAARTSQEPEFSIRSRERLLALLGSWQRSEDPRLKRKAYIVDTFYGITGGRSRNLQSICVFLNKSGLGSLYRTGLKPITQSSIQAILDDAISELRRELADD